MNIYDLARGLCGEDLEETSETIGLKLTKAEFMVKMREEVDGDALLDLLESGEHRVCERLGLCNAYIEHVTVYFDVPRWKALVAHLRIVNSI